MAAPVDQTIGVAGLPTGGQAFALTPSGRIPDSILAATVTYIAYTPTWTSTGTAPALGNATVTARYTVVGKLVHYVGAIDFGSSSTFGTGAWDFSLPASRATGAVSRLHGLLDGIDVSSGARVMAVAETVVSVSSFRPIYASTYLGAAANLTATAPWTWASGDTVSWNLFYESA